MWEGVNYLGAGSVWLMDVGEAYDKMSVAGSLAQCVLYIRQKRDIRYIRNINYIRYIYNINK